jgi:hypothetical protein
MEHPEMAERIEAKVRDTISTGGAAKAVSTTKPEPGEDDGDEPEE